MNDRQVITPTPDPVVSEVIHRCPSGDDGVTPCCGRTPFELPPMDRMTVDSSLVTCAEPVARPAATGPVPPSLAQIVAALSVTYSDEGVLIWLTANRVHGPVAADLVQRGELAELADMVRWIGDADPADFEIVDKSER